MITKESVNHKRFFDRAAALLSALSLIYLATAGYNGYETKQQRNERIKEEQGHVCGGCGAYCRLEVHHRTPRSRGGTNNDLNLIALGVSVREGGCGCHDKWDEEALS